MRISKRKEAQRQSKVIVGLKTREYVGMGFDENRHVM